VLRYINCFNEVTYVSSVNDTLNVTVDLSAQSAVVPAGSKLGLRTWGYATDGNDPFRIYHGYPEGKTSGIGGHLIVEETN
jgi:hypothetical protein